MTNLFQTIIFCEPLVILVWLLSLTWLEIHEHQPVLCLVCQEELRENVMKEEQLEDVMEPA